MRPLLLLGLAIACGDAVPTSATPADPSAAPPPTETQEGGDPRGEIEVPPAPEAVPADDMQAACTSAMRSFPDQPSTRGSTASDLTSLGKFCREADRNEDARHLYLLALTLDANHALAHYNLAIALMRLHESDLACEYDATISSVMHHLERAVAIDARQRAEMEQEPALASLKDNLRFRMLLGVRMGDPASMRQTLSGTTVYGPGMGAFGSLRSLTFEGTGDGGARSRVRVQVRTVGDDGPGEPTERLGYWEAQHGRLTIKLPKGLEGSGTMTITPQGDLVNSAGTTTIWYTAPSECDA